MTARAPLPRSASLAVLAVLALVTCTRASAAEPVRTDPPKSPEPLLVVVPLGEPSPELVRLTAERLGAYFALRVEVAPPRPMPEAAWYAPRKRWRAEKILEDLDRADYPGAWRVAAITEAPISTTKGDVHDWGIAGLGSLGGRSSVFSAYYFRPVKESPEKYRRYLENLVLHEVGHTLGLPHCPLDRCIMADAKGHALRAARRSINELCPRCWQAARAHVRADAPRGDWTATERARLDALGPLTR
ncbi:archaemetzincin [Myxococcota bacterium]|nr:archaemetzincin [Myxococcota bacterium]